MSELHMLWTATCQLKPPLSWAAKNIRLWKIKIITVHICLIQRRKREAEQSQLEGELVYYWDTARWGYQKSIKLYSNKSSLVEEVTFNDSTFALKDFLPSLLQLIRSYPDPQLSQINSVGKGPLEITQASAPAQGMANCNRLLRALSSQVLNISKNWCFKYIWVPAPVSDLLDSKNYL